MRAREFISETAPAKISKRNSQSTRGLHKFRDPAGYDRAYDLNRVMMAAACTDGESEPWVDQESWAGKHNTAHPYSEVEQKMLKKAYAAAGINYQDLNHGDLKSRELDSVQSKSPVLVSKRPKFK